MQTRMIGASRGVVHAIVETFPWDDYRCFVDLGTAQGALSVRIAAVHEHLIGGGFDLPAMRPVFEKYVAEHHLDHRLRFFPGDLFKDPLPATDVLILGHIVDRDAQANALHVLIKAYEALTDEGALIVYGSTPSNFAGSDWMMWMRQAGFRDPAIEYRADVEFVAVGIK